jgi:hypothetical protein
MTLCHYRVIFEARSWGKWGTPGIPEERTAAGKTPEPA